MDELVGLGLIHHVNVQHLPVEVVTHAVKFLPWNDRLQLRGLSRTWEQWYRSTGFFDLEVEPLLYDLATGENWNRTEAQEREFKGCYAIRSRAVTASVSNTDKG